MGTIRQSKYAGNQYWTDVLYHVHEPCDNLVTLPLSDALGIGGISGCLLGVAEPSAMELVLTHATPDNYGVVTYSLAEFQTSLTVNFDYYFSNPSSGNGADAVFFYFNSSADAIKEDDTLLEGYTVGFSEYHQMVTIRYGMDFFQVAFLPIVPNTPYHVAITFNEGDFGVYINGGGALFATDPDYNTRVQAGHTKFGLGARCGADWAQHTVNNLSVVNS